MSLLPSVLQYMFMMKFGVKILLFLSLGLAGSVVAFDPLPEKPGLDYFQRLYHIQHMNYLIYKDLEKLREEYPGTIVAESIKYRVRWMILKDYFADEQILCIRGTNNLLNAWIDSQYFLKEEPEIGIKLHRGFNKAVKEILPTIKELLDPNRKVILSGHSLGGSMAIILAMYLEKEGFDIQWIVTMGQPKITDAEGAERFKHLPLLRLVYKLDLVPSLPPPLVTRYHHFGSKLDLFRSGYDYQADPPLKAISKKNVEATNRLWKNIRSKASKALNEDFRKLYDIKEEVEPRFRWFGDSWFFGLQHKMGVYRQKVREIVRSWKENLPWRKNKKSAYEQTEN